MSIERERAVVIDQEPDVARTQLPTLITGGAGFIGSNVAHRILSDGGRVILYDNLSRPGVQRNVAWLRQVHGERVEVIIADICDVESVRSAVQRAGRVYHFAAQVAVTTSLTDPLSDFIVNARGTLNLLEAIRTASHRPPLLFTSTNKVYGGLDDVTLTRVGERYMPADPQIAAVGIDETRYLDFHSPYGCSKGAADQYVLDYARSFGLKAVVFRMSCIYGPHQFGTEDQGWVAHFLIRALEGEPIVLYGDGRQVRDVLFVDDLVSAMLLAQKDIDRITGQAFNIGGGADNTVSLLELLQIVGKVHGTRPNVTFNDWRTGDQRYYVSNTARFRAATGWQHTVGVESGVRALYEWLATSRTPATPLGRWTTPAQKPTKVPKPTQAPNPPTLNAGDSAA